MINYLINEMFLWLKTLYFNYKSKIRQSQKPQKIKTLKLILSTDKLLTSSLKFKNRRFL